VVTPRFWAGFLVIHLLALAALGAWVRSETRLVDLPALHLEQGERLRCVSYAPYYLPGQTPLDPTTRIPREQIEADLKALAPLTECVRIYSVHQGLEQVPAIAQKLGLKVLMGGWIGLEADKNRVQIETLVKLANAYPNTIRAVIVGNEVLLRREQTEAGLRVYIEEVKSRVKVPVTYADVWEFWMRHPDLESAVDFVTVHILPFWEDDPVAVEQALIHVGDVRALVTRKFTKPVLIGETGWPSAGRQREGSRPSLVNQARYVREFIHQAHAEGWDYNLIEALDQPWKRRLEGTVGGYWGILDTRLQPKFSFTQPVAERASASPVWAGMGAGALLGLVAALVGARRLNPGPRLVAALAVAAAGALAGAVGVLAWEHARVAYRNELEWLLLGSVGLGAMLVPLLMGLWGGARPLPSAAGARREERSGKRSQAARMAHKLSQFRLALLYAGATAALLLVADPRYRDFPTLLYAIPALSLGTLGLLGWRANRLAREERLLGLVILLGGLGRWLMEPTNLQAIAWGSCCLLLAAGGLLGRSDEDQQGQ
jgi:glucan 1,3-beta-glucosidase